jgi:hypothetical protein
MKQKCMEFVTELVFTSVRRKIFSDFLQVHQNYDNNHHFWSEQILFSLYSLFFFLETSSFAKNTPSKLSYYVLYEYIGCSFKFILQVGVEDSIVIAPRITNHERLNDPGHSILVRKSYNFGRYLNLTFTDLENIANLLFKN